MNGWTGKFLRVNLTKGKAVIQEYDPNLALTFLGGRGFAVKILWDEVEPGIDALSPKNKLIFAAGPLTAFPLPSSGKLVVAAKSPLTGGYGDGNIGTLASVQLRRAGYDALVLEGKAKKPTVLWIDNDETELLDGRDLWGLGSFETEKKVKEEHGGTVGVVEIGPAGENLVKISLLVSQEGRAGGRPGMGAVMGSKNLKAVAIKGSRTIPATDLDGLKALGTNAYEDIVKRSNYDFWRRQGTMVAVQWCQENSVLPTHNFREGIFDKAEAIDGFTMEKLKVTQRDCGNTTCANVCYNCYDTCPAFTCNTICGNVIEDAENRFSELDYENVSLLGSNIGLGDLKKVAVLNRLADDYGLDTISLGSVIGFAMEASEKKLIDRKIEWGDFDEARALVEEVATRRGIGDLLAEGVRSAAEKLGDNSSKWAMHVKGLEISGYDCHTTPGMALAFGTSSIGAHHKDAWVISWEVTVGRETYSEAKVDKLIEFQRIRGGMFESLVTCRLPWIELGFEPDWYLRFLKAATGVTMTLDDIFTIADRMYTLIRAFWVREYNTGWSSAQDYPPARWFSEPLTKGPYSGATLDRSKYETMLQWYYQRRGWDRRGIPREATLKRLGLEDVAQELEQHVKLVS
ncbi:MAG: aldehyde ferredoxin oxidoreductase family protein [Candidatus Bathyarchaeota archaeon]|nr:MAG: aldehyde ferredoxin oxidoreductase family protein [Candidatus Bathyarchaeota archaeon]